MIFSISRRVSKISVLISIFVIFCVGFALLKNLSSNELNVLKSKIPLSYNTKEMILGRIQSFLNPVHPPQKVTPKTIGASNESRNPLDGCLYVYVDVGSNRGIQVRKLFEPHLFPGAPLINIFDAYFGPYGSRNQSEVCAVGFEPNPEHGPVLTATTEAYQKCGWRVMFHLGTAAGGKESKQVFSTRVGINDMGGRVRGIAESIAEGVMADLARQEYNVTVIRLSSFLKDVVATRRIPQSSDPPRVVMKLDIEGAEREVVPDLVMSGALSGVDNIHFDWHISNDDFKDQATAIGLRDAMNLLTKLSREYDLEHQGNMEMGDDETYGEADQPLPKC